MDSEEIQNKTEGEPFLFEDEFYEDRQFPCLACQDAELTDIAMAPSPSYIC